MDDENTRLQLPIHLVLGTSDYTRIKTISSPMIALTGHPVAEKTTLGWTIMSPGHEHEASTTYDQYDAIIQAQREEGIVEPALTEPKGTEFYIPHGAVVHENAETTKLRIVSMPQQEKAPTNHLGRSTHSKRMVHARHVACTARRSSISPLAVPMLLMWLQDGPYYFRRGYALTALAPTKPIIVAVK